MPCDDIITPNSEFVNSKIPKIEKIFLKPLYKSEKICYNNTVKGIITWIVFPKTDLLEGKMQEITYIERIKQLKSEKKITNDKLSELTGIPLGTLSKILAGISDSPKLSNIVAICAALECSLDYILTGVEENTNNFTLDPGEISLIENYRRLDKHGKELVGLVLNKEYERVTDIYGASFEGEALPSARILRRDTSVMSRASAFKNLQGFSKRQICLYDMPVSAGTGVYLTDMDSTVINIPDTPQSAGADFALRINGNSMEPKYRNGDILLCEECDTLEFGELGIFILDGDGYFKRFEGDRLISLNPEYSPILLSNFEEVTCCGRVVGKLKRK